MLDRQGQPDFDLLQDMLRWKRGEPVEAYWPTSCSTVSTGTADPFSIFPWRSGRRRPERSSPESAATGSEWWQYFPEPKAQRSTLKWLGSASRASLPKRQGSPYQPGVRSPDWLKIPLRQRADFIVCGHVPNASDERKPGGLILAEPNGQGFRFVGTARVSRPIPILENSSPS